MESCFPRAMEILRMTPEQVIKLQTAERNKNRCFMPFEIQNLFNLLDLKITYCIPDLEASQNAHISRLRSEFYANGLLPQFKEIGCLNVDLTHDFDSAIVTKGIDFVYSGAGKKRRLRDQIEDDHWQNQ